MKKQVWRKRGSYTVEAALVLPMILIVLSAMLVLGFQEAQKLGLEAQSVRREYKEELTAELPALVRAGQAAADGFWEES